MAIVKEHSNDGFVLALPKGRILSEILPILEKAGIRPEPAFMNDATRKLRFATSDPDLTIVKVRSFDVATFVAFGAADLGIVGNDVLMEFDYQEIYAPLDLGIGRCRLAVAEPMAMVKEDNPARWSSIRIATKYPNVTRRHFAERGVQAECVKLSGAMELAPALGLSQRIVDLVSTGATLRANGLVEMELIAEITSRLIVNRGSWKIAPGKIDRWINAFRRAVGGSEL